MTGKIYGKCKSGLADMKTELKVVSVFLFIVYLPFISGQLNSADGAIRKLFRHGSNYRWENNQGRFFLRLFDFWRDGMILPSLIIGVCLFLLLISVALIWNVFGIQRPGDRILAGILVSCTPSMANLFTYYYTADGYCFGILLAVLAAVLLIRGDGKGSLFLAAVAMVGFLGLYQAYLGITITICGFWLLVRLLENQMGNGILLQKAIRFLTGGVFGVGIYMAIFTLLDQIGYLVKDSSRGAEHVLSNVFIHLLSGTGEIYSVFAEYFWKDSLVYNSWHGRRYVNLFIIVLILFMVGLAIWHNKVYKNIGRFFCSILLVGLVPVMLEIVILIAPDYSVHAETGILALCDMNYLYLLPILLLPLFKGAGKGLWGISGMAKAALAYMAVFMFIFIGAFARMAGTEQQKFEMLAYGIESRIEQLEDYSSGMKVLVVGRPQNGNYPFTDDYYKTVTKGMITDYSLVFGAPEHVSGSWVELLKYYCGVCYEECSDGEREQVIASEEFSLMGNYPSGNAVKRIGDVVVVRLSE